MISLTFFEGLEYAIRLAEESKGCSCWMELERKWTGNVCHSKVINQGDETVQVKEIVLFKGNWSLPGDTGLYGEGYQMLAQYGGTLDNPEDIGSLSDRAHYKMPQSPDFWTVYNMSILSPKDSDCILMAFSSCNRFNGLFRFGKGCFEIVLDTEGLSLEPGQHWNLEEFLLLMGPDREKLLEQLSEGISIHHPRLKVEEIPTGWCSWYYYGPNVTEKDIFDNMETIAECLPELKYIQIDDGYQAYMGDWLTPGTSFSSDMKALCHRIKDAGFEPAVWAAPFIAEEHSQLFQAHPDWFVMDKEGKPLLSSKVSFGGWRRGPWYMLDGTHPGAQSYLTHVFKTMREDWSCKYFKLDANTWGALHGGRHYDPSATRVEAYRRGMTAVMKGAGTDSFILGCNAPLWPSLGMVHGMRVTGDISRSWTSIRMAAKELFWRNWQHNRLWINDPDCIVLENVTSEIINPDGQKEIIHKTFVSEDEYIFHATCIFASGGMVLSGDKLTGMTAEKMNLLKKLLPPRNAAARFDNTDFSIGRVQLQNGQAICLLNWEDHEGGFRVKLPGCCKIRDFWTGEDLGIHEKEITINHVKPHSARLLLCSF